MLLYKLLLSVALIPSMTYSIQGGLSSEDQEDIFVPTHEWQRVQEGQAIPSGLHVRMDMTNGGKWAKLLDDGRGNSKSKAIQLQDESPSQQPDEKNNQKLDIDELKQQMKKIKSEKIKDTGSTEKKKFRSMDEIRADLEDLQVVQESDFDVMSRMLSVATSNHKTADQRLTALEDLEYYVHQVDNANDFIKIDGIKKMLELFKSKETGIREQAVHVVGTAAQGNPSVQIRAVELHVVEKLLEMLKDEDESVAVKKKCLYSLSCLIRQFPHAQHLFAVNNGFQLLFKFFTKNTNNKLLLKSIQLVSDIKKERLDIENQSVAKSDSIEEKRKQYNRFNLTDILVTNNWCDKLVSSLKHKSLEMKEKSAEAMQNFVDVCRDKFNEDQTVHDLTNLLRKLVVRNEWGEDMLFQLNYQLSMSDHLDADHLLQLATDEDELEKFARQTSNMKIEL